MKRFLNFFDLPSYEIIKIRCTKNYSFLKKIGVILFWQFLFGTIYAQNPDVPYVPSAESAVEGMLNIAHVEQGDYLIDLGSGDGRIVIAAAKRGAVGHGVEIDPDLIKEAYENAENDGVEDKVVFVEESIFETDFSCADVVTLYLFNSINMILRPHLLSKLRPGSRVVSNTFHMNAWKPDKQVKAGARDIYLWIIPANVKGTWIWMLDGNELRMDVDQEFQEILVYVSSSNSSFRTDSCSLSGNKIWFNCSDTINAIKYVFNGIIESDSINGTVQVHSEDGSNVNKWSASRIKVKTAKDEPLILSR